MDLSQLTVLAENTVATTRRKLPPPLRALAEALPVIYHDWPSDEILGEEFEPDILGMFVGNSYDVSNSEPAEVVPHILLFVENIWDLVEGDREDYVHEVKLTYLHELGHYFGWDEDEVAARGLE